MINGTKNKMKMFHSCRQTRLWIESDFARFGSDLTDDFSLNCWSRWRGPEGKRPLQHVLVPVVILIISMVVKVWTVIDPCHQGERAVVLVRVKRLFFNTDVMPVYGKSSVINIRYYYIFKTCVQNWNHRQVQTAHIISVHSLCVHYKTVIVLMWYLDSKQSFEILKRNCGLRAQGLNSGNLAVIGLNLA